MNPDYTVDLLRGLLTQAVTVAAPFLLTALVVGLSVSLFQTITSIQEQTLTFVPKALAVVALLFMVLPWLIRTLMDFTVAMISQIPNMVR
ncbi:MAG: flagellar biosynthesis protein FliQ [Verrucomicrobia bacterium]|jgi:flagellar biosynthesis protein FliQ|nr:flagellar biosynthesis protein FliQ [Verrucomicrobiota bacterium]